MFCGMEFFLHDIHDSWRRNFLKVAQQLLLWLKFVQDQGEGWSEGVPFVEEPLKRVQGTAHQHKALLAHLSPIDTAIVRETKYLTRTQTNGSFLSEKEDTGVGAGLDAMWRQM